MEKKQNKQSMKKGRLYRNFLELVGVGSVTGIFAGAVVTLYVILVREGERIAREGYAYVRENPVFIPVLLAALVLGAFLLGTAMNIASVIRGCGIPQAEGATRGIVPLKWWRDMIAMFSASLLSVFMGLSIGSEGPSVLIGACGGDGVSSMLKRDQMIRRYQITGGACAGLAVASNAPLTGMAFAFEEAHKRFTPEVFICAFVSVIFGVLTRTAIYNLLGMEISNAFGSYRFFELPLQYYPFVVAAGIVCGLLGVLFYRLCFIIRRLFKKVQFKKPKNRYTLRVTIAVLLGGIVSLIAVDAMGGGHNLIESLGTFGGAAKPTTEKIFGLSLVGTLIVLLLLKLLTTTVNVGSGIPCGIFIPIIAIGACIGSLLNEVWISWGMDEKYCDILVMICMAAFFSTVVKAPITSIVMICEFTGSFAPLLPVIIGVFLGYIIGELAKTDGIYEELLEHYEHEVGIGKQAVREIYTLEVTEGSLADKREVRGVLWPIGARVTEIRRGDAVIIPDGGTILHGGDMLTIVVTTAEHDNAKEELTHILG